MLHKRWLERGNSLVETALVLPVVLIVFLGIIEVGFFLFAHVQIANATREGARYGSLCRQYGTCDQLTDVVESTVFSEAQFLNMTDAGVGGNTAVTVQPASLASVPAIGEPITVTVTYDYTSPFISNFVPMFPAQIPIQHTLIMHFDK